jgi:hypothetical protein
MSGVDPGVSTPVDWGSTTTIKVNGRTLTPDETREFMAGAVESFAKEAGIEGATVIEPRNEQEAAAVQLARNLGREIVLVSGKASRGVSGMIDEQGRMFVHAESANPLGVAVHEMGHSLADTLGEIEAEAKTLGETEALGLTEAEADPEGETEALGLTLALADPLGLTDALGDTDALADPEGLTLALGLTEALADTPAPRSSRI